MAKKDKNKDEPPSAANIVNKDIMQRLNFMYQASVYLSGVLPVPEPPKTVQKRAKKARKMNVHDLSKAYINSMKTVASKTMVKMDPAVKRTLCNGCNIVLVPGSTATVRVKSSKTHGHVMHYRCTSCKSTRRIPAPPTLTESVPAASTSTAMEVDSESSKAPKPLARLPPLFARNGHVVLCGNDTLPTSDLGNGIYIT
ncbi:RNAse P Rpr2/Rpp21/SNM1 subunit domain-containing protein [Mycena alexandri]|uniref:RNAse P Rpr2/Rpp21/SNM1 subunit domain-containing protein n=1 Tax=Mycena alexandri TaxID=1745969 RepID=A0AAD6TIC0_9AGAR|nr:RNAse P Rpr2/Rpp21/SNM1 subunit domain-containing protein [Mycena alexandri]